MVPFLILALVALQERPAIQEIRTLTGGYARSGCWLPLKVRVAGPAGFEGEVTASADAGFRVTRPFQLTASGTVDLIVPVVLLAKDAKIEVTLRGAATEVRKTFLGSLTFLDRDRLVLVDPRHPECESLKTQALTLPGPAGAPIRFAESDPADWNEAADMGALEAVDGVVASDEKAVELTMPVWRALGGALMTQPRRELFDKLAEPCARFPAIDAAVGRFTVSEEWIPRKRDATLLFVVIYGFGFFVAVYVTWSRKGGPWLLLAAAVGMAVVFLGAYSAFFPKGNIAVRTWQGIVAAPESPVAISICALWGSGRVGDVEFGRIVKPVHATVRESTRRDLELRWVEGHWAVRGTAVGDSTRFVCVERLAAIEPFRPYVDASGEAVKYKPEESDYYRRVPRKKMFRLVDPASAHLPAVRTKGLIETAAARVFRVQLQP